MPNQSVYIENKFVDNATININGLQEVKELDKGLSSAGNSAENLERKLKFARQEIEALEAEIESLKNGTGFASVEAEVKALEERIQDLNDVLGRSAENFRSWLKSVNLMDEDGNAINSYFDKLASWIEQGSITMSEAITKVKAQYGNLLGDITSSEGSDAVRNELDAISSMIIGVSNVIDDLRDKFTEFEQKLNTLQAGGAVSQIEQAGDALGKVVSGFDETGNFANRVLELLDNLNTASAATIESLSSLNMLASEISKKEFGTTISLNAADESKRAIAIVKEQVIDYAEAVDKAAAELSALSHSDAWRSILSQNTDLSRELNKVIASLMSYSSAGISKSVSSNFVQTASAINKYVDQVKTYADVVLPFMEKLNSLGLTNFNTDILKAPVVTEESIKSLSNTSGGVSDFLNQLISGLQQTRQEATQTSEAVSKIGVSQTANAETEALGNESNVLSRLNAIYELHRAAVESATSAEAEKTAVSQELLKALQSENEAMGMSNGKNWFDSITEIASAIRTATEQINTFVQSLGQLNDSGNQIEQNLNEPLQRTRERLKEIDITFLESQLRVVGAKMEALKVPTDDMTNSLVAMEQALEDYKNTDLPIATRNAALTSFNSSLKTANQLISEQTYLNREAAKELKELTSAEEAAANASTAKRTAEQAEAYNTAKTAVRQYYNALIDLNKDSKARSDIVLDSGVYQSVSGEFSGMASRLNRVTAAFGDATAAMKANVLAAKDVEAIDKLIVELEEKLAIQIDKLNRSEKTVAVKVDTTALNSANAEYEKLFQTYDSLGTKTAETTAAMDELTAAMERARATEPGTEARTEAMAALRQAMEAARPVVEAQATAEREEAAAAEAAAAAQREEAAAAEAAAAAKRQENTQDAAVANMKRQITAEIDKCTAAEQRYEGARNIPALREYYAKLAEIKQKLQELSDSTDRTTVKTGQAQSTFAALKKELGDVTSALGNSGNAMTNWWVKGVSALKSRLSYTFGMVNIVMKTISKVKELISTAVELDSAMNTLQIVTKASSDDMAAYADNISAVAQEIAQSTKDLIDATTVFARLGYSMDESTTLAKYTAMLQNVGDISASDAQDAMTAIIKAFDKNVDDIEDVMDKLVTVGNNFPISVSQLAEGMNNAGSMLDVAGNTFEQSIALLTAANTTIQDISKSSTGLRTIAARIRKTNTEEEDGEVLEESKYQEMLNILTEKHVNLVDEVTGEYRSTYDVIKDIAGVWSDLTSMEKAAVTEALAGTRQQNVFSSLVLQFQEAEDAMKAMGDSAGALSDAYSIYLDSIQAHVQQLKAAWEQLSTKVVNSEFAKNLVDSITNIINFLSNTIDKIGALNTVLVALGSVAFIQFITGGGITGLILDLATLWIKLSAFVTTLASVSPYLIAIAAGIAAITAAVKAYKKAHPTLNDLTESAQKAKDDLEEVEKQLRVNAARIEELNEEAAKGTLTSKQAEEIDQLKKENQLLESQLALRQQIYNIESRNVTKKVHQELADYFASGSDVTVSMGSQFFGSSEPYTEHISSGSEAVQEAINRYSELQDDLIVAQEVYQQASDAAVEAGSYLSEVDRKMAESGIDLERTVFGNIDTNNRAVIEWTEQTIAKYKKALESWDFNTESILGQHSNVLGTHDYFDIDGNSIAVAFSPILQTTHGPIVLEEDTVKEYIQEVLNRAAKDGEWSIEEVLQIDTKGIKIDGKLIKGLIADIGDEAEQTAVNMHFFGDSGEDADAMREYVYAVEDGIAAEERLKQVKDEIVATEDDLLLRAQELLAYREFLVGQEDEESLEYLYQIDELLDQIGETTNATGRRIDKFKRDLDKLNSTIRDKLVKGLQLTNDEEEEFYKWLQKCGYEVDDFNAIISELADNIEDVGEQMDEDSSVEKHIAKWATLKDEIEQATAARDAYNDARDESELAGDFAEARDEVNEEVSKGRYDTDKLWKLADWAFTDDQIAEMEYDARQIAERLNDTFFSTIFNTDENDETGYGMRFFKYLQEHIDELEGVSIWQDENGNWMYNIDSFADLADQLKTSQEVITMLVDDLDTYGIELMGDNESLAKWTSEFKNIESQVNSTGTAIDATRETVTQFVKSLLEDDEDLSDLEIERILDKLTRLGYLNFDSSEYDDVIATVRETMKVADEAEAEAEVKVDKTELYDIESEAEAMQDWLTKHPLEQEWHIKRVYEDATENDNSNNNTGNSNNSSSGNNNGNSSSSENEVPGHAGGKRQGEKGGDTLVNELGPELISDRGRAFIANGGRPGFVNLSDDAIVFTADETKDILRGKRNVIGKAYATGTVNRSSLIDRLTRGGTDAKAGHGNSTSCPKCGKTCASITTRCVYCGYSFYTQNWSCPTCGWWNPTNVGTCSKCGGSRYSGTSTTSVPTPTSSSGDTGSTGSSSSSQYWQCSNCLYYNPSTTDTCLNCNQSRYGSSSSSTQTWQCEYCLHRNPTTTGVCENCHRSRYGGSQQVPETNNQKTDNQSVSNEGYNYSGSYKGSGGGGDSVGSSDYTSSSDPDTVDWIAVLINRIERVIADLEEVATSGFKSLDTRLDAARKQIQQVNKEIDAYEDAYERYMTEAESVDLDENIKEKIRNGTINIEEYDSDTKDKIDEYTEWYEKALDAKSAVEGLHQDIAQIYKDMFDNVQTDFENQLDEIEHRANMIQKNIDMASTKGYLQSAEHYQQLSENQQERLNKLKVELQELQKKMDEAMASGEIEKYSEAWYDMQKEINAVKESIADANTKLIEYERTIRQISWDHFDYAIERFSQMSSEAQFMIDLMSHSKLFDDNGKFNDYGEATAGLHALNYNVYMQEADEYAKELAKIEEELAKDPYDTDLIARRETLLGLQQQAILSAEGEKEAVKSLVQEGINLELGALKDLIDAYEDSLDSAKDLYEYQKKIAEKTKDIASIQKQLSAYQNDTSEETRAKVQQLQVSLKEAQTDLAETERDQSISDQKKLLSDLYDEYQDYLNERLDNIDLLMQDIVAGTNENMNNIRNTLVDVGEKVGYTVTEQMTTALSGDLAYYNKVFDGFTTVQTTLTNIYNLVGAMAKAAGAVKAYATGGLVDYTGLAAVHGSKQKPEMMLSASDTENFLEAARMMRSLYTEPSFSGLPTSANGSGSGFTVGQLQVNIPIDHVQDYNDLVSQMRDDPKFERLISAMTLDRAVGKSSFGKNRIQF